MIRLEPNATPNSFTEYIIQVRHVGQKLWSRLEGHAKLDDAREEYQNIKDHAQDDARVRVVKYEHRTKVVIR